VTGIHYDSHLANFQKPEKMNDTASFGRPVTTTK